MADLSQKQLEEMVEGKKPNPNAIFYEHATLDVVASKAEGRRVYKKVLYIKLSQPGVVDTISYEAQRRDIQNYHEEYQYFLQNKQGSRAPGIEIIPNLDIAHLQEFRDMRILTIPQLASLEVVPPHLEYARRAALVLNDVMKEMDHGNEEDSEEEGISQEGRAEETRIVPPTDRQEHGHDVGRREVPRGVGRPQAAGSPQGHEARGRPHGDQGVNGFPSVNWSINI